MGCVTPCVRGCRFFRHLLAIRFEFDCIGPVHGHRIELNKTKWRQRFEFFLNGGTFFLKKKFGRQVALTGPTANVSDRIS